MLRFVTAGGRSEALQVFIDLGETRVIPFWVAIQNGHRMQPRHDCQKSRSR
jgi:hypothetical protein